MIYRCDTVYRYAAFKKKITRPPEPVAIEYTKITNCCSRQVGRAGLTFIFFNFIKLFIQGDTISKLFFSCALYAYGCVITNGLAVS